MGRRVRSDRVRRHRANESLNRDGW